MKKIITLFTILAIFLTSQTVFAKSELNFPKIIIKHDDEISYELLTHRKEQNLIIISYLWGEVVDNNGNGKDEDGYYIYYPNISKGKKVLTMFSYDPNSNAIDDVIYRCDEVVKWPLFSFKFVRTNVHAVRPGAKMTRPKGGRVFSEKY